MMGGRSTGGSARASLPQQRRVGADQSGAHVVTCELSRTLIGVIASSVLGVADHPRGAPRGDLVDLAALLRLPPPPAPGRSGTEKNRKVLVVATRSGLLRLLVGEATRISTVPRDALHELPRFLAHMHLEPISGLFVLGDRLGFLIDAASLKGVGGPRGAP